MFTRYLLGRDPDPAVVDSYERMIASPRFDEAGASAFDRRLLRLARKHPFVTRALDGYTRIFLPHSLLRKRLIGLLAILESRGPSYESLDAATGVSRAGFFAGAAVRAVLFAIVVGLTALLLLPSRMLAGRDAPGAR